ncbi:MAG: DsrE family protein [Candidatus Aramenus sp.]|nr:DsrE family protein [Candidatus Aramenus sp.]
MKTGIIVGSNEASRLAYAAMTSVIVSSMGDEVYVFLTMDAVKAFTKTPEVKTEDVASKAMVEKKEEDYISLFKKAKKTNKVKIYACSYASKLFNLTKADYNELVDEIAGITSFSMDTEGAQIISVW